MMKKQAKALAMLQIMGLDKETLQHIDPSYGKARKPKAYRPQVGEQVNTQDLYGRPITGTVTEVFPYHKEALLVDAQGNEHAASWHEMTPVQKGA